MPTWDERGARDAPPPVSALATLAELGVTPDEIRPHLRTWADSELRIIPCYARLGPPEDDLLRQADRAHLSLCRCSPTDEEGVRPGAA